ncbi:MAG: hypothetical protein HRT94_05620 [Alphaproteobacteria bacterium]|nr:hypothetical protein [Alphaproteobacteria bacterium]
MNARTPFLYANAYKGKRKITSLALLCLMIMGTGACGYAPTFKKVPSEPPPEHLRKPLNTAISIEDARDLAKPANKSKGFGGTPQVNIGQNKRMRGLQTGSLFSDKVTNDDARFERLESAVNQLHTDFMSMKPAIEHLITIEKDIQNLMRQLQIVINNEKQSGTPIIKTSSIASDISITKMRVADHDDKTRLVLETSHNVSYTLSLDPVTNEILISFDKGHTLFNTSGLGQKSNLIDHVSSVENGKGSRITIKLTKPSTVLRQGRLGPSADKQYHRIFIDLEK